MRLFALVAVGALLLSAVHGQAESEEEEHACIHDTFMDEAHLGHDTATPTTHAAAATEHRTMPGSTHAFRTQAVGPIRFTISTTDLYDSTRYCQSADIPAGTVWDFQGGSVTCADASDELTTAKRDLLINTIIPAALNKINSVLSIDQLTSNLVMSSGPCTSHQRPASFSTTGVADTDFILLVSAAPNSGSSIAWAGYCTLDAVTKRPLSGRMCRD